MKTMGKRLSAILIVWALMLWLAPPVHAEDACSDATLSGDFGFSIAGHNFVSSVDFVYVGRFTADGNGSFNGTGMSSTNGNINRLTFTGKYSVAADCTGTASLSFRPGLIIKLEYVLVDGGREAFVLIADTGVVEHGSMKRIAVRATTPTAPPAGDRPKQ